MKVHKEAAVDFLQLVVDGNIDKAYEKHVDMERDKIVEIWDLGQPVLTDY